MSRAVPFFSETGPRVPCALLPCGRVWCAYLQRPSQLDFITTPETRHHNFSDLPHPAHSIHTYHRHPLHPLGMTNKKRKAGPSVEEALEKPWCYYCERDFNDQRVLIDHQKAKHFSCRNCPRKLNTPGGLSVHMQQVHKETLTYIDNAIEGREGVEPEIFGMMGVPEQLLEAHKQRVLNEFFKVEAERRALTGNPPPGQKTGEPAVKKTKVETSEGIKARLAEHKAKLAAKKQALAEGNVTPTSSETPAQASAPAPAPVQSPVATVSHHPSDVISANVITDIFPATLTRLRHAYLQQLHLQRACLPHCAPCPSYPTASGVSPIPVPGSRAGLPSLLYAAANAAALRLQFLPANAHTFLCPATNGKQLPAGLSDDGLTAAVPQHGLQETHPAGPVWWSSSPEQPACSIWVTCTPNV